MLLEKLLRSLEGILEAFCILQSIFPSQNIKIISDGCSPKYIILDEQI